MHPNTKDLTGLRVGIVTAIRFSRRRGLTTMWWCRCDCGSEEFECPGPEITRGQIRKSCGCARPPAPAKHRMYKTPEYRTWSGMKNRCTSGWPWAKHYYHRGIVVCERWQLPVGDAARADGQHQ